MSAEVAAAKVAVAVAVASDKRGRAAIATILCSLIMLFFLPLIVYMGVMGNIKDLKIDTAQAQQIVIQNLSVEDKETLTHLETVMNNIQTEFQNRKLDNYTIKMWPWIGRLCLCEQSRQSDLDATMLQLRQLYRT